MKGAGAGVTAVGLAPKLVAPIPVVAAPRKLVVKLGIGDDVVGRGALLFPPDTSPKAGVLPLFVALKAAKGEASLPVVVIDSPKGAAVLEGAPKSPAGFLASCGCRKC